MLSPFRYADAVTTFDAGAVLDPDYYDALKHIYGMLDLERMDPAQIPALDRNLEKYARFLAELGDPHLAVPTIHVTGTRGKGSTVAHLEAILLESGYSTGATVSPHLVEVRERVRLNGEDLTRGLFASLYKEIRPIADRRSRGNHFRTVFELLTALAFCAFRRAGVAAALVEVGMGGKLDATSVIHPVLAIITRIGLDHTHVLGNTVGEIAADKAHIIKPGVPAVIGPQTAEAMEPICSRAKAAGGGLWRLGREAKLTLRRVDRSGVMFDLATPLRTYRGLKTPLLGAHQGENAAVAVLAADRLKADGLYEISRENVFHGLQRVNWPGRGEVINDKPEVLLDGAHTPQGATVLDSLLVDCWPGRKRVFLLGFNRDKDLEGFLGSFSTPPESVLATSAVIPRALEPEEAAERICRFGWPAQPVLLDDALDHAMDLAGEDGLVVVTGSLYLVGAVRREFLRRRGVLPTLKHDETGERVR